MKDLRVEFINPSPSTIEVRKVETMSLDGLAVPPDTVSFNFFHHVDGAAPQPASPVYFLSRRPEVFRIGQLITRFPDFAKQAAGWSKDFKVQQFGLVTYILQAKQYHGAMIIPLMDTTVLLAHDTLAQVWPPSKAGLSS